MQASFHRAPSMRERADCTRKKHARSPASVDQVRDLPQLPDVGSFACWVCFHFQARLRDAQRYRLGLVFFVPGST
jgi:hypothetical protein